MAVLASSLTYAYSIRVTRKSRLYEARLKLYSDFLGRYQQALTGVDKILQLKQLDLLRPDNSDESWIANKTSLLINELVYAGDSEVSSYATDIGELTRRIRAKGEEKFLEELRARAIAFHSNAIQRVFTDIQFMTGQLALVTQTGVMPDCIKSVTNLIRSGYGIVLGNDAVRNLEQFKENNLAVGFASLAKSREEWLKEVDLAIECLMVNVRHELEKTL